MSCVFLFDGGMHDLLELQGLLCMMGTVTVMVTVTVTVTVMDDLFRYSNAFACLFAYV
jgi:hypothetical protein